MPSNPWTPPERTTCFWEDLPGYRADLVLQNDGSSYYWHVYRGDERVNGGLSPGRFSASRDAELAAFRDAAQHCSAVTVLRRRVHDEEEYEEFERYQRNRGRGSDG